MFLLGVNAPKKEPPLKTLSPPVFVGRKDELNALHMLGTKKSASLVVIRGRRRIGKSRLVQEFARGKNFLHFSGIPPTTHVTAQSQRDVFASQLGLPGLQARDWSDLFTLLARQTREGPIIILFDEISWMGSLDPTFLGKLKNVWDMELSHNPDLILILCGSVSTWIETNIIKSTAFFGRISLSLGLEELPLRDCNTLLNEIGFKGSVYEKFKILSVTGGVPWYIELIRPQLNADENITTLCFRTDGALAHEFDLIFHDLFTKRSETYKKIIEVLANGPLEFKDIAQSLTYANSGTLSDYLEDLIQAGFITRDFTWLIKTGKASRLSHFRLSDNYLRFFLKCMNRHKDKIARDGFRDVSLSTLPGWDAVMGLQFENLVLKNRREILKKLAIRPEDIVADNPFFQRKTRLSLGCQIDYLIQTRFNMLFACEVKFSRKEISSDVIQEMTEKLSRLSLPKGFACRPVLIHACGVNERVFESQYFELIDLGEMLEESASL